MGSQARQEPDYGASSRYLGAEGVEYFERQNALAVIGGKIEAFKFQKYISPSDCVLDFGCAAGYTLKSLRCARRIGVEINPVAREVAKANGIECHAMTADVPEGIADVVISNHALEHVPYPIAALRELVKRAKPAGVIVLYLPVDDWRTQRDALKPDIHHHLHTWTPVLFANTLAEAGIERANAQVEVVTHAWCPGYHRLFGKVPNAVFDLMCWLWSLVLKRRQLKAVVWLTAR